MELDEALCESCYRVGDRDLEPALLYCLLGINPKAVSLTARKLSAHGRPYHAWNTFNRCSSMSITRSLPTYLTT